MAILQQVTFSTNVYFQMQILSRLSALLLILLISACGNSLTKETDETEKWSAEKFYTTAKQELKQKNYELAIEHFEKLEARFPYGRFVQQAQLDIAYAYYQDGKSDLALAAVERFIHLHPAHSSVDYAYYLKGLISFNTKRGSLDFIIGKQDYADRNPEAMQKSYDAFKDLVERFPDSRYAVDGRKRLIYLQNLLAKHEMHVARHYFEYGAYVATVNRTKYVLENFQHTPAVEDALGLQIRAYQRMGMQKLAHDAARVLKKNFPNSSHLKKISADSGSPASSTAKTGNQQAS